MDPPQPPASHQLLILEQLLQTYDQHALSFRVWKSTISPQHHPCMSRKPVYVCNEILFLSQMLHFMVHPNSTFQPRNIILSISPWKVLFISVCHNFQKTNGQSSFCTTLRNSSKAFFELLFCVSSSKKRSHISCYLFLHTLKWLS